METTRRGNRHDINVIALEHFLVVVEDSNAVVVRQLLSFLSYLVTAANESGIGNIINGFRMKISY